MSKRSTRLALLLIIAGLPAWGYATRGRSPEPFPDSGLLIGLVTTIYLTTLLAIVFMPAIRQTTSEGSRRARGVLITGVAVAAAHVVAFRFTDSLGNWVLMGYVLASVLASALIAMTASRATPEL